MLLPWFLTIEFVSCKTSEREKDKKISKLEIAKQYYKALDNSDSNEMKTLIADSLSNFMPKYDYTQTYSRNEYVENWLRWDSVFDPIYKILEIEQENEIVKAKISKNDNRIHFLQKEPFITNETLKFDKGKITTVEMEYVTFKEKVWDRNKTELLRWIEKNHPELDGFMYDQTETGGMKYLKAIELYKNKK